MTWEMASHGHEIRKGGMDNKLHALDAQNFDE